jgi:hypothetical protein
VSRERVVTAHRAGAYVLENGISADGDYGATMLAGSVPRFWC